MKKWTGFITILSVLLLVAYFIIGFSIKNTLTTNINSIPKTTAFSILLDKYHRGWFSSQAILSFKMHIPAQSTTDKAGLTLTEPPVDLDIDIPLLIKHGPFIFGNNGLRFGLGLITTNPQTHYEAFVNYLNKIVFNYRLPSFGMEGTIGQNEGDFKFNWQGLISMLQVSANLDQINGNMQLVGLTGAANNPAKPQNNADFKVGEITYDIKMDRYLSWLWLANSHFNIPSLTVGLGSKAVFELVGFDFFTTSKVHNNELNFDFKLSLNKVLANSQHYGPGMIHLSIRKLDPVILAKINQEQLTMAQNNSDANLMKIAFLAQLPKLIAKGTVIELADTTLSVPEGKIIANFKLSFPPNNSADLAEIMKKMQGEGYFKAPISIVKTLLAAALSNNQASAPQESVDATIGSRETANTQSLSTPSNNPEQQADTMLNDLLKKGFLKVEGSDYVLSFKLENEQIFLNNHLLTNF